MLTLVIDTSQTAASVALRSGGGILSRLGTGRVSDELPALVEALLLDAGVETGAIGAVVASSGPGSLTGLRIGRSFGRGFAAAVGAEYREAELLGALARCGAARRSGAAVFVGAGNCSMLPYDGESAGLVSITELSAALKEGEWTITADLAARIKEVPPPGVRVVSNGAEVIAACL